MSNLKPRKRKKNQEETPRKVCASCQRDRRLRDFYQVDSPLFPDGRLNICVKCVREQVDINNLDEVIAFLRQIDKPFIEEYWKSALVSNKYPLGEYLRKINSLEKGKDFTDSNITGISKIDNNIADVEFPNTIKTDRGRVIEYDEEYLISKWGKGYKKDEYLKMEKFYQDMMDTHEIHTPIHKDMLIQLAKLAIRRDRYLEKDLINEYEKASRTFEAMMKSAGFRPVDRQGIDEMTGIRTFSQIFEEVEKRGFRKPPPVEFNYDIVDKMIASLANYYHRLVGKAILTEMPEEIKKELGEYFDDRDTFEEIGDYDDLFELSLQNEEAENVDDDDDEIFDDFDNEDEI